MDSNTENFVQQKLTEKKVVVFSKTYCPYCTKAKKILDNYSLPGDQYEIIELDKMADRKQADSIQQYMKTITGASSVPRVFIDGKCIGGGDDTEKSVYIDKS